MSVDRNELEKYLPVNKEHPNYKYLKFIYDNGGRTNVGLEMCFRVLELNKFENSNLNDFVLIRERLISMEGLTTILTEKGKQLVELAEIN